MLPERGLGWLHPLADGSLRRRDVDLVELMDAADADAETLRRTYDQFAAVNAAFSGWRATYRRYLRPLLSTTRVTRVLDVGSGGGDLTRRLALWAARDGLRVRVTGIDPDARAAAFAAAAAPVRGVDFSRASTADLVAAGERFDLVVSNHVLHHLSEGELARLLADSETLAPRALHGDITRSAGAYAGFGMVTWPVFPGSFIRVDGLRSIRRSYRPGELAAVVPQRWRVLPQGPTRYLLAHQGGGRA